MKLFVDNKNAIHNNSKCKEMQNNDSPKTKERRSWKNKDNRQ